MAVLSHFLGTFGFIRLTPMHGGTHLFTLSVSQSSSLPLRGITWHWEFLPARLSMDSSMEQSLTQVE